MNLFINDVIIHSSIVNTLAFVSELLNNGIYLKNSDKKIAYSADNSKWIIGGVVGDEYALSQNRINVLDEYIPLRKTFEKMNFEVIWTPLEPKKIVVNTGESNLVFTADTNLVTIGDKSYKSDRAAYIENGVTYISADCIDACVGL